MSESQPMETKAPSGADGFALARVIKVLLPLIIIVGGGAAFFAFGGVETIKGWMTPSLAKVTPSKDEQGGR